MSRTQELKAFDASSGPVLRWLAEVDDLIGAVAVAGLAWPDADLASDLRSLADRAEAIGAEQGAIRLAELGRSAAAVRAAENTADRTAAESEAFAALMRLMGWLRRFRVQLDLVAVQAALVVRGTSEAAPKKKRGPVASMRLRAVGAELSGAQLVVHAVDLHGGGPAMLVDRLQDVDDTDPLARPVISRLFQSRLRLGQLLDGVVDLEDHPVQERGGGAVFRPAFEAPARLLNPDPGSSPPTAPDVEWTGEWSWPASGRPGRIQATLGREAERVVLRDEHGEPLQTPETPVLRFTATKLSIREPAQPIWITLRSRREVRTILAADHPDDGRCWPAMDPRAFPLSARALGDRVQGDDPGALWTRAALARQDGETPEGLAEAIAAATPTSIREAWRLGRAAVAIGAELAASWVGFAAPTLASADADGDDRWCAIWLIIASQQLDRHGPALQTAWDRFYDKPPTDPTPGDVCARAMLIDLLDLAASEELDAAGRAVAYLDAHLSALRLSARAREPKLPSLAALAWLAEARSMLTGDGGAAPLALLDIPADRLRLMAIEALWAAFGPEPRDVDEAGDAVWAMALAGMAPQLF